MAVSHESKESDLSVPLGKDEFGAEVTVDLHKLPHLLMSGMTGTGKSTLIHNILIPLLLRNGPDKLRLILVDFKRVELPLYDSVPHLLTQVILEPKKALLALKWLNKEVDRRLDILKEAGTTHIEAYHKKVHIEKAADAEPQDQMPYILCVMDEFSDGMISFPKDMDREITRLTQMSREVGIHLILSTSRPSKNVVTAAMKANIPARAIFQVASPVDSRWVLGITGAETARDAGGMLFQKSGMTFPANLQVPLITEDVIRENVEAVKVRYPDYTNDETVDTDALKPERAVFLPESSDEEDELYADTERIVREVGKASTSFIQRKLGVGYARAARLIDILTERGVIAEADGARPREVINAKNDD